VVIILAFLLEIAITLLEAIFVQIVPPAILTMVLIPVKILMSVVMVQISVKNLSASV